MKSKQITTFLILMAFIAAFASAGYAAGDATVVKDFTVRAAEGLLPNVTLHSIYSQKETQSGGFYVVYPLTGVDAFPAMAAADTMEIASSSVDDVGAVVTAYYLDTNWDAVEEDITLNGQTEVAFAKQGIRLNTVRMKTPATGKTSNVGEINVAYDCNWTSGIPDANQLAIIRADEGTSKAIMFSVPRNKVAIIDRFDMALAGSSTCEAKLVKREFGGAWTVEDHAHVYSVPYRTEPMIYCGEKSDVYLAIKGAVDSVAATMRLVYHIKEEQ